MVDYHQKGQLLTLEKDHVLVVMPFRFHQIGWDTNNKKPTVNDKEVGIDSISLKAMYVKVEVEVLKCSQDG